MRVIEHHVCIDSTSSELQRRVRAGDGTAWNTVLVADHQTAGRGQHDRAWLDCPERPGASLLMSMLWRSHASRRLSGLSLALGLALLEGLRPWAPEPSRLRLKWPNDLLIGEGKAAGILIESLAIPGAAERAVVIGLGVNLCAAPMLDARQDARPTAALLPQYEGDPRELRAGLLPRLIAHLEHNLSHFAHTGFAPFQPAYEAVMAWRGQQVIFEPMHGPRLEGTLLGVSEEGALRLATADQTHTLHSGSLRLRNAMAMAAH